LSKESAARWAKANPEKRRQQTANWRAKHPEHKERARVLMIGWRKLNPGKIQGYKRRANYGLDSETFDSLLLVQNNQCAICKKDFLQNSLLHRDGPHVDHDHNTGVVRGLLCVSCNNGLGRFKDNSQYLRQAANYLESNLSVKKAG
jgi:hypothetical protein